MQSPEPCEEPTKYRPDSNRKMLPCVIKWNGGGQNVALSGTFNQWQKLPMVKRWANTPLTSYSLLVFIFCITGELAIFAYINLNPIIYQVYNTHLLLFYSEKDFVAIVNLPEGEFEYKFEVDGEWRVNPNEEKQINDEGNENNVIAINENDFAELENELLKDPNDVNIPDPFSVSTTTPCKHAGNSGETGIIERCLIW